MLPVHGKTRRGRPPKYQQYWLSLAKQRAEEKANLTKLNGEAGLSDASKEAKTIQKDYTSTTEDERLGHTENGKTDLQHAILSNTSVPMKPRTNSWPVNVSNPEIRDVWVNHCTATAIQQMTVQSLDQERKTSDEGNTPPFPKKRKQDQGTGDNLGPTSDLHSPWNNRLLIEVNGWRVPLQQALENNKPKSPPRTAGDGFENETLYQRIVLNSQGLLQTDGPFVKKADLNFRQEIGATQNWLANAEKSECPLDLSNNRNASPENCPLTALDTRQLQHSSVQERRAASNPIQAGSAEQVKSVSLPWNQQLSPPKQAWCEHSPLIGVTPQSFPYSRLAEVQTWTVDQVAHFVSSIPECHDYAECFRKEDIDGSCLLQLSESHLRNIIQMKLGPSLHLKKALDDLTGLSGKAASAY